MWPAATEQRLGEAHWSEILPNDNGAEGPDHGRKGGRPGTTLGLLEDSPTTLPMPHFYPLESCEYNSVLLELNQNSLRS